MAGAVTKARGINSASKPNWIWRRSSLFNRKRRLTHPDWIYAFNDETYKLYPVWKIEELPGMVDHENYDFLPVGIINRKLVELNNTIVPALYTPYSMDVTDWSLNAEIALEAMKSSNPDASVQLLGLIIDINKKCLESK